MRVALIVMGMLLASPALASSDDLIGDWVAAAVPCQLGQDGSGKPLSQADWDAACAAAREQDAKLQAAGYCWDDQEASWVEPGSPYAAGTPVCPAK